jgi:two-component system, OmpR family, KDP operon response regulator KdpE
MLSTDAPRSARPHPTILVVDDDEYVHGTLAAALRQLKPTLIQARTAADGLALAIEHQPALAIVDLGLPDASGYELTQRLRATPGLEPLRIVILTGYEPDPAAAQQAGGDEILGKPFRLHEFLEVVNRLLEPTAA